jgi:Protein of unknown function (DUF1565)/Right handed beta helix region
MSNTVIRAGAYALRFSLLLAVSAVQAADLYVSTQGSDSNPGSSSQPFRTITYAYSKAAAGTTIHVMPGVYTDCTSGWGIHLNKSGTASSPIVLAGSSAIVDGQNSSSHPEGFYMDGTYNTVTGFEIRNNPSGGIAVYGNNNRIVNNDIHSNGTPASSSTNGRDGVYSDANTSGNYYGGNTIHNNGRTGGSNLDHGLYLCGKNETVVNNLLYANDATGLQVAGYNTVANMKVYNNVIAWNGATGIILWQSLSGVDIKNNIIYHNGNSGIGCYQATGSGVVVDHNVVYGNGGGNYNLSGVSYTMGTTLSADPKFVNAASASFDAHLSSGAPGIGAGLNLSSVFTTDESGAARPASGAWDIGAFVYGSAAAPTNSPPANSAPTISAIANQTVPAGGSTGALPFTLSDAQTAATSLTVAGASSSTTLVPTANLVLGGSGASRTVTVTPASGQTGTATITLTVSDGTLSSSTSFTVTINAATTVSGLSFAATAGTLTAPFAATNGAIAQPVNTSVTAGGQALYTFNVPAPGDYVISAQVYAPNTDYNSFYINIDGQPTDPQMIWDIPVGPSMVSQTVSWRGNGTVSATSGSGLTAQYAPKVFTLTAGTHQLIVRGREANCQLGTITITPNSTAVTPPPVVTSSLTFSATAGTIAAPFQAANGMIAQLAYTGSLSASGQATYSFSVSQAGYYVIQAVVNAPTTDNNSVWINIDAQPTDPLMVWDMPVTTAPTSQTVSWRGNGYVSSGSASGLTAQYSPKVFNLTAGTHQLIIRGREASCQIGTITIAPTTLSPN